MTKTITIALTETEMRDLYKAAALDCRRPQDQARFFIKLGLKAYFEVIDDAEPLTSAAENAPNSDSDNDGENQ